MTLCVGQVDRGIFSVWANILRHIPLATLEFLTTDSSGTYLQREAAARGISPKQLQSVGRRPVLNP